MVIMVHGLVKGTTENYADRILSALATMSMLRFGKKTLVLQATTEFPIETVMQGKKFTTAIKSTEYAFEDSGIDALIRRSEIGQLTGGQFADCCYNVSRQANGLDIAGISKNEKIDEYLANNEDVIKDLLTNAKEIYDCIFIMIRGRSEKLIELLKEKKLVDKEVICIPQGPKKFGPVDKDVYYAVKNYDRESAYSIKAMSQIFGIRNIFPIPYNVMFKDACLSGTALTFLSTNVAPDDTDDNSYFSNCIANLLENLLGIAEPNTKENRFVYKGM